MSNHELCKIFLRSARSDKNLSNRTLKAYSGDLRQLLEYLAKKQIANLKIEDLRDYIDFLSSRGMASASIKRKLATIKSFFSFLESEGYIDSSPAKRLRGRFRIESRLPKVLANSDIRALLVSAYQNTKNMRQASISKRLKAFRDRAILELLFSTGIRIDELVSINLNDINLNSGTLIIFGKGRKERLLYLSNQEVKMAILDYIDIRNGIAIDKNALFINKSGTRLSVHSIRDIWRDLCDKAKVSLRFTPHCLRHTMATMLIENGADVRSVQEILGHSSISITERYISVSGKRKEEVLNRFNQRNLMNIT